MTGNVFQHFVITQVYVLTGILGTPQQQAAVCGWGDDLKGIFGVFDHMHAYFAWMICHMCITKSLWHGQLLLPREVRFFLHGT